MATCKNKVLARVCIFVCENSASTGISVGVILIHNSITLNIDIYLSEQLAFTPTQNAVTWSNFHNQKSTHLPTLSLPHYERGCIVQSPQGLAHFLERLPTNLFFHFNIWFGQPFKKMSLLFWHGFDKPNNRWLLEKWIFLKVGINTNAPDEKSGLFAHFFRRLPIGIILKNKILQWQSSKKIERLIFGLYRWRWFLTLMIWLF